MHDYILFLEISHNYKKKNVNPFEMVIIHLVIGSLIQKLFSDFCFSHLKRPFWGAKTV